MAPVAGKAFLNRVMQRVYQAAQDAGSREEHELFSLSLRLLGEVRKGTEDPWTVACYAAFGCSFEKWKVRSLERQSMLAWELARCVPDYDPEAAKHAQMVQAGEMRRPETGTGNLYAMPTEARPAKQKSVQPVPARRQAVGQTTPRS
jgi:hypothetical protein